MSTEGGGGRTVAIAVACACGAAAVRQVSQFVGRDGPWWDAEFSCDGCGLRMCEYAGPGPAPDAAWRRALVAVHGTARLRSAGPLPRAVAAMKVFREVHAVPPARARELVEQLGRDGVPGTVPELEFLASRMRGAGVPVVLDE
ncbi:hypothetical protein ACFCX4_26315 [Kitasatospora sp. NPDC056327]|uniref:hypothetical protein n=1 Tax=Kitasatospora sp. NPDC056327 TaxID=3345785 RepID=UPI0035DE603F